MAQGQRACCRKCKEIQGGGQGQVPSLAGRDGSPLFFPGRQPGQRDPVLPEHWGGAAGGGSSHVWQWKLHGKYLYPGHRPSACGGFGGVSESRGAGKGGSDPAEPAAARHCQQGEVGIFVPHEPRDPHSHERDHRYDGHCPAAGPEWGEDHGLSPEDPILLKLSAGADQRYPWHVQDRKRQDEAGGRQFPHAWEAGYH